MPSASRRDIVQFLDDLLNTAKINDSCRNGLQVQGADSITRVGLAVDACVAAYRQAVRAKCQMLIVHHGLLWDRVERVTGRMHMHMKFLLEHDLNLYASHLPLDLHAEVGNNAQLAQRLGVTNTEPFGLYHGMNIGVLGTLAKPTTLKALAAQVQRLLGGKCELLPFGRKSLRRIAIVSGAAGSLLDEAVDKQADCYLTGEPSHSTYQASREAGINVLYAGHYHSEQLGVQELGRRLTERFGIQAIYLNEPSPV